MTVLQIINRLEELEPKQSIRMFDCFGQMFTPKDDVDSWRGSYNMPAVKVDPITNLCECTTAEEFILELKSCDSKKITGWKGGDYILSELDTLFLVSEWGTAGNNTMIEEIYDDGYCVVKPDSY